MVDAGLLASAKEKKSTFRYNPDEEWKLDEINSVREKGVLPFLKLLK